MNTLSILIPKDHLLYKAVSIYPGLELLTDLDRLVLSGLMLFVQPDGLIVLTNKERKHLMEGLSLQDNGFTNVIHRLIQKHHVISRHEDREVGIFVTGRGAGRSAGPMVRAYKLHETLLPLASLPKEMKKRFTIQLVDIASVTNKTEEYGRHEQGVTEFPGEPDQ